jgi:hypothetical protein
MPVGGPQHCQPSGVHIEAGPGVPDWYTQIAETTELPDAPGVLEPVYHSDDYYEHYGSLVRAFGARYDGHPNLFAVDSRILDWWGEGGGSRGGEDFQAQTDRLIECYVDSFKKTHLVSQVNGYQLRAGIRRGCGWRADSFGDVRMHEDHDTKRPHCWNHMYNYYPMQVSEADAGDVWRTSPVVMEAGWVPMYWRDHGFPIDWIIQQGLKYHVSSLMLKSSPVPPEWKDKMDDFLKRIGYRFVLRQLMAPKKLRAGDVFWFYAWIENVGIAPIYRSHRLAFRLTQGDTCEVIQSAAQPKSWLPGDAWLDEKLPLPPSLKPGAVDVCVSLVDPTSLEPSVRFANVGDLDGGWFPLTQLTITSE